MAEGGASATVFDVLEFLPTNCSGKDSTDAKEAVDGEQKAPSSGHCEFCAIFLSTVIAEAQKSDALFRPAAAALLTRAEPRRPSLAARLGLSRRRGLGSSDGSDSSASPQRRCSSGCATPPVTPASGVEAQPQQPAVLPSSPFSRSASPAAMSPAPTLAAASMLLPSPPAPPHSEQDDLEAAAAALAELDSSPLSPPAAAAAAPAAAASPSPTASPSCVIVGSVATCSGDDMVAAALAAEATALLQTAAGHASELRRALAAFDSHHHTTRGQRFLSEGVPSRAFAFYGGAGGLLHELRALTVRDRTELESSGCDDLFGRYVHCPICLSLMLGPTALPMGLRCGHCVCGECLALLAVDAARRRNGPPKCPVCRQGGALVGAVPLRHWDRLLRRLYPEDDPAARKRRERSERNANSKPVAAFSQLKRAGKSLAKGGKALLPGNGGSGSTSPPLEPAQQQSPHA